jgi:hypothetical protein
VVIGQHTWITFFKPDDKRVFLARDMLLPLKGSPPFPGFNQDGLIAVGYAPPLPADGSPVKQFDMVVLWITMFKITDEGTAESAIHKQ